MNKQELLIKANEVRKGIVTAVHAAKAGHPGGSLGQGISAAVGMALSAKLSGDDYRVYTLLGDGEIQEGQVWEAAMFAGRTCF